VESITYISDIINPGAFSDRPFKPECDVPIGSGNASTTGFSGGEAANSIGDFSTYDAELKQLIPTFVTVWSTDRTNSTKGWADTRLVCLGASDISKGSRGFISSASGRLSVNERGILLVLSVASLWMMF
jgi:hypothetical protein